MQINTLREKINKKRTLKLLNELPHVEYANTVLDLKIERYPISNEDKKELLQAYKTLGVFAYTNKRWLIIKKNDISISNREPSEHDLILPSDWQKYAVWVK